jgi:hypothetical protein
MQTRVFKLGGEKRKAAKFIVISLLVAFLAFMPLVADAHWGFGGGAILGFGLGLFTGLAFAPRPVYVAPPVYYALPPPVVYPYYVPAPVPRAPATYGYSNNPNVSSAAPLSVGQKRRPSYWYYCQNPQGYYPYVKSCPAGWMKVVQNLTPPNQ